MAMLPNLAASRLPTLADAATIGNPQGQATQANELARLLGQYQQAQANIEAAQGKQAAEYIPNSGALGALAVIANKYMGGRARRKEGETAAELTQRILAEQARAEGEKALAEENRKAAAERAKIAERIAVARRGDAAEMQAYGIEMPKQPEQEYTLYDGADGPTWIPKPMGQQPQQSPAVSQQAGTLDQDFVPMLENAVMQAESGGDPNAVSPKGAVGTMQTMPATLRDPGFGVTPARDSSPGELERVGKEYLSAMLNKYGDPKLALAAYNWGPGNVDAAMQRTGGNADAVLASAPAETRNYVPKVLAGAQQPGRPGGVAAIPVSGVRPKPKDASTKVTYTTLSPQQAQQRGYRHGTIVQMGSDGSERITQAPATKNDAEQKRQQDVSAQAASFDQIESLVNELERSNSDSGTFEVPFGPAREQYQNRASRLGVLLKPLIRGPGEGTWTDADQALLERLVPQASNYENTNLEAISGLRSLLDAKRAGLGIKPRTPDAPRASATPAPTGLSQAGMAAMQKYGGL